MSDLLSMAPAHEFLGELALRETRVIILPEPVRGLPSGEYAFVEFYCVEVSCDCRRTLIRVVEQSAPDQILATINFGWESLAFYARWMHGDKKSAEEMMGAWLDPTNPQSEHCAALLELFREFLTPDKAYVARLGRHYRAFKKAVRRSNLRKRTLRYTGLSLKDTRE